MNIDINKLHIPKGSFLATDSKQVRQQNPDSIQNTVPGGMKDRDQAQRGIEGIRGAVADWLTLFQCEKIYEIGFPPKKSFYEFLRSTFIDAHRIMGKEIINITNKYEKTNNSNYFKRFLFALRSK